MAICVGVVKSHDIDREKDITLCNSMQCTQRFGFFTISSYLGLLSARFDISGKITITPRLISIQGQYYAEADRN